MTILRTSAIKPGISRLPGLPPTRGIENAHRSCQHLLGALMPYANHSNAGNDLNGTQNEYPIQ